MNRLSKFIAIAVLATAATAAIAQNSNYTGPSSVAGMTAKQLLANGVDDQYVTLNGKLLRHTGGKHYVFADASGEIPVEISEKYFPANQNIDANTAVELTGKFDKSRFGTSKLEVKQVKVK